MNRRELFGSLLGIAVLPLAKFVPAPKSPLSNAEYMWTEYHVPVIVCSDEATREAAIIELTERRIREFAESWRNAVDSDIFRPV